MGTKWRNKVGILICAFLFTFGMSGILSFFSNYHYYVNKSYFDTPDFQSQLDAFAMQLTMFELDPVTEEEAKKNIKVSQNDIDEHRYRYGKLDDQIANIMAQYEHLIQDALNKDNKEVADAYTKQRDEKIADITKNFESDEHVRLKVIKEKEQKIEEYFEQRESLRASFEQYKKTFHYYFKNTKTGNVFTNIERSNSQTVDDYFNNQDMIFVTDYFLSSDYFQHYSFYEYEEVIEEISQTRVGSFEGKISIPTGLAPSTEILREYQSFDNVQKILWIYSAASILALLISLVLAKKARLISNELASLKPYYNKLPIDTRVIFWGLSALGTLINIAIFFDQADIRYRSDYLALGVEVSLMLGITSIFVALFFTQAKYLLSELKDWQGLKHQLKGSLTYKVARKGIDFLKGVREKAQEIFMKQSIGRQLFIVLGMAFLLGLAAVFIFVHPFFLLIYVVAVGIVAIPIMMILVNRLSYFNQIVLKTNELAAGNLGRDLDVTGHSVFSTLASNINKLKQGVKQSQNEQAKSERLKTELITNVSHDLRTPLTSIITYTELLKKNEIAEEDRAAYLEIIDRKSKRLKVLIDDLFEVSKMASGNMQLNKEKVDLVQLLQQALGEYDDTINESNLQFRFTTSDKPIFAIVDGQKLWRVFDNLIGNILKYSLEHTRVYITIEKGDDQALITFKNVSKYELGQNIDELFERFKRGDVSRHTEGSGLGLAISKSIVDLHDGALEIEADGDLFKVTITMELEKE
ncbi:HAMP domain-containing histidine kinase [Bacillus timonensis]|nr:HAMP domain-containing histidine kinase [Bacillus timonensis]